MSTVHDDEGRLVGEDVKLQRLATVARTRALVADEATAEGAAVRDTDGRTYAAATVEAADGVAPTSAVRGAVSAAASSGARALEAAVLLGGHPRLTADDAAVLAPLGEDVPVHLLGPQGVLMATVTPRASR